MNKKTLLYSIPILIGLAGIVAIACTVEESHLKTDHFSFKNKGNVDPQLILELANALEGNYARISNDLKTIPAEHIEVNIYASRWRYILATGNWTASGNIEGISKLHFVDQAWSESDSKKVALHEFTHAVVLKLLIDRESKPLDSKLFDEKFSTYPVWLWEAVSVYEAGQFTEPKSLPYVNGDSHPGLAELNIRSKGGKIYSVGYTIVEYIKFKYGNDKFIDLIGGYGDVQKVLNVSEAEFSNDWYAYLKMKYLR